MKERLRKEFRAILPAWLLGMVFLVVTCLIDADGDLILIGYIVACAVLGALPFGIEYSHRTMPVWLAQPLSKRRLWYEKMLVLAGALAALSVPVILWWSWPYGLAALFDGLEAQSRFARQQLGNPFWLLAVPPICALATGPAWSLLLKNPVATAVLAPCVAAIGGGVFLALSHLLMPETVGELSADQQFTLLYLLPMLVYTAVMYLAGCWYFRRLQAADRAGNELVLPEKVRTACTRLARLAGADYTGTYASLLRKELHLHSISWLLAALFGLGCLGLLLLRWARPQTDEVVYNVPLGLYWFVLPLTVGAVAVAEERHLGLWECQLTLPPSLWRQWWVKMGAAFLTLVLLGGVLPLAWLFVARRLFGLYESNIAFNLRVCLPYAPLGLLVAALAIEASSLCLNTMRATLLGLGLVMGASALSALLGWWLQQLTYWAGGAEGMLEALGNWLHDLTQSGLLTAAWGSLLMAGLLASILFLAFTNFRRIEPNQWRRILQYGWVLVATDFFVALWVVVLSGLNR